jgi:beta-lactam-binding protein with PASTA domain
MRRFFRIVFQTLVLLVIGLASAFIAMRSAIHGREVAVPKFIGATPAEADRLALANGLTLQVENRFYSADVPAGRILNQVPAPGETVRRGWRVRVAESMGPQRVTVPNVVGQSLRAAQINLARRGLQVGNVIAAHLPDAAADTVVAQSPSADAEGVSSPKVNLVVATADADAQAIVMPDLVGRSLDDAERVAVTAGLRIGRINTISRTQPAAPSTPASNAPPANASAAANSAPQAAASSSTPSAASTLPIVVSQAPAAGQKVLPNANVNMDVVR